jgi:putative FmdB family regulatory protein
MPLYEYECEACGHRFEKIQKFSDAPVEECPNCGQKKIHKLVSSPAIQFKGTGWYITDYARKGTTGGAGNDGSAKSGDAGSSDSKAGGTSNAETKSGDTKSTDAKSTESKSSDGKSSESKSTTTKS